jgi:UDPglucose 6-dehydrogenase
MKIGIAGYGYVGQAHEAALKDYHEILISDPALGHYADLQHADAIIICVSTPQHTSGACNINNVYDIVSNAPPVPILIKSTISLEGWDVIRTDFISANLTFSPEFLRAATALEDFANTKDFMMGGDNVGFWADILITALGNINVSSAGVAELILTKYFRNAFLATKVTFFNQMYDLCKAAGIDYDPVAIGVGMDPRIGDSHIKVTEMRGYGGHCFPKDMNALVNTAKTHKNTDLGLINQAINYNSNIRKGTN